MNRSELEANVRKVVAAFNRGNHGQARTMCEQGLAASPADPVLNHLYANVCLAMQDCGPALRAAEASLAARPANPAVRLVAGRAARGLQRYDEAISYFADISGHNGDAAIELARTFELAGRRGEAMEAWASVCRREPSSGEAAARLGRLFWEDGRHAAALPLLERAATGDAPASAWFDLALARQDTGDLEGAAAAFRGASERNREDAEAAFNLGAVLQDLGRFDEAVEAYRAAYALKPDTLGMIANALTSASVGMLFVDRRELKAFLGG